MVQINANLDERIVKEFRHVIYTRAGLKKGDFKKALEQAMLDYILKYAESKNISDMAELAKALKKKEE